MDAAEIKGAKLTRFIQGPLRSAALMGVGLIAFGQILDSGEKIGDKIQAKELRMRDEYRLKKKDKDEKKAQAEYDAMVQELYMQGVGRNYINATPGNYFGYTPGLVGDPNAGLVQRMFDKRIGHTKM